MEKKMEMMRNLVEKHMDAVEKETGKEFSRERRNEVIRNCQDTLSDEELNMSDKDFTTLINEWLEDGKQSLLEDTEA